MTRCAPFFLVLLCALLAAVAPRQPPVTAALLPPSLLQPPAPWQYLTPADEAALRSLVAADLRRPQPTADGYTAELVEQRLAVAFTPEGLTVHPSHAADWQWTIAAVGLGRAEGLVPLPTVPPEATDAQVRYWRAAVEEWYRLAPAGIEQGFTVAAPPVGSGPLRLALRVTTELVGEAASARDAVWRDAAGAEVLTYRGLRAWDAAGRELGAWLAVAVDEVALWVDDAGALYPLTIDPLVQQAKLVASDGAAFDAFGGSVALSSDGNTALVEAWGADIGGKSDQGAAYVFVRSGTAWSQQAKLLASDGAAGDNFGLSVALSSDGNTALVGAPWANIGSNTDQGAAYVFGRSGTAWSQQAKLVASDGAAFDEFGVSVALSSDGNTALVGAPFADIGSKFDQGAAYVFVPPCTPRPNVGLAVTPTGDGRLRVVITANTNPGASPNTVQSIQFQTLDNATVRLEAQPGIPAPVTVTSPTTVTLASPSSLVTLFVSRVTAGQASTVHVVVTDGCGPWRTFFGGGPTAF